MATKEKVEIKGYTAEERAAISQAELRASAEELERKSQHLNAQKLDIEAQQKKLQQDLNAYRKTSVYRVLDFIAYGVERLNPSTIRTLLVHCMNKLNGNIDGIECTLKYDKEAPKKA